MPRRPSSAGAWASNATDDSATGPAERPPWRFRAFAVAGGLPLSSAAHDGRVIDACVV